MATSRTVTSIIQHEMPEDIRQEIQDWEAKAETFGPNSDHLTDRDKIVFSKRKEPTKLLIDWDNKRKELTSSANEIEAFLRSRAQKQYSFLGCITCAEPLHELEVSHLPKAMQEKYSQICKKHDIAMKKNLMEAVKLLRGSIGPMPDSPIFLTRIYYIGTKKLTDPVSPKPDVGVSKNMEYKGCR